MCVLSDDSEKMKLNVKLKLNTMKVKQLHRLMPHEVAEVLNYMAQECKGEDSFSLLEDDDQMDVISLLCDNPTLWYETYKPSNLGTHKPKTQCN